MGPIGMPELIVIALMLLLLAVPVAIVFIVMASKKKPPQLPSTVSSAQERLAALEDLRSRNLISDGEYVEKRKGIVDGL